MAWGDLSGTCCGNYTPVSLWVWYIVSPVLEKYSVQDVALVGHPRMCVDIRDLEAARE